MIGYGDEIDINSSCRRLDQFSVFVFFDIQIVRSGSDSSVCEHDVDAAERLLRLLEQFAECFPGCYIRSMKLEIMFTDALGWLLKICTNDCSSFIDEQFSCCKTDARRCSCRILALGATLLNGVALLGQMLPVMIATLPSSSLMSLSEMSKYAMSLLMTISVDTQIPQPIQLASRMMSSERDSIYSSVPTRLDVL